MLKDINLGVSPRDNLVNVHFPVCATLAAALNFFSGLPATKAAGDDGVYCVRRITARRRQRGERGGGAYSRCGAPVPGGHGRNAYGCVEIARACLREINSAEPTSCALCLRENKTLRPHLVMLFALAAGWPRLTKFEHVPTTTGTKGDLQGR